MWGVQGWGTSLLPHPPSHALGDGPVRVLPSIPGASLLPWQSRAGHWLKGSRAFALYHDLQQGWGRCQPAVNATDPEQDKNLWGSGEQGKGWGCCKSLPNTGTPSKSHPCEVFQPFSVAGRGGTIESGSSCPGGTVSRLESALATLSALGAALGPVPRQEGRELGRAGRGAPASRGSGVSCTEAGLPAAHGGTAQT